MDELAQTARVQLAHEKEVALALHIARFSGGAARARRAGAHRAGSSSLHVPLGRFQLCLPCATATLLPAAHPVAHPAPACTCRPNPQPWPCRGRGGHA